MSPQAAFGYQPEGAIIISGINARQWGEIVSAIGSRIKHQQGGKTHHVLQGAHQLMATNQRPGVTHSCQNDKLLILKIDFFAM